MRAVRVVRRRVGRLRRTVTRAAASRRAPQVAVGAGSSAEQIAALQTLLNRTEAARLEITRIFDEPTRAAVKRSQRRLGLPRTGVADPLTLALILHRHEEARRRDARPRRFALALPPPPSFPGVTRRPIRPALILEAPPKSYVPRVLEERGLGGYEPATMACFLAALDRARGGVVFDVGANVGLFALVARSMTDAVVVAFEPAPDLAATVRRNSERNNLAIQVEELAVGRSCGTAALHLSNVSDASHSLDPEFRPSSRRLTVAVETLDNYCARTGLIPTLLKIDTESTEADVLAGARGMLAAHRPWLLVEVLPGPRGLDVVGALEQLGYHRRHLVEDGGHGGEGAAHDRNWLFSPVPLDDEFCAAQVAWRRALDRTRLGADPAPARVEVVTGN